jgi:hypothetical protein
LSDINIPIRLTTSLNIKGGVISLDGITYDSGSKTYTLSKNITWATVISAAGVTDSDHYIQLDAGETFEGNNYTIDFDGVTTRGIFYSAASSTDYCTI